MTKKKKLKEYYIERKDVSWCVVLASSPLEAANLSGSGNREDYVRPWDFEAGELEVTLNKD